MTTTPSPSYTSFDGWKCIASGDLPSNALAVRQAMADGPAGPVLVFDDSTGRVVDIDTRGSDAEVLARLQQVPTDTALEEDGQATSAPRGRGRPRLGVVAREVTLLPRHWDWLSAQPGGASVVLRKLVDEARRNTTAHDERRQTQERAYRFMSAMAGDMAGFEESTRALFAGDAEKFVQLTSTWPTDVRDYTLRLAGYSR